MEWEVEIHEEFEPELNDFDADIRREILAAVLVLRRFGPGLGRPRVDTLRGSEYPNMKELRVQITGDPWRVLFAFDPNRRAILLLAGNKGPDEKRWYKINISIADQRFSRHLATQNREPRKGNK